MNDLWRVYRERIDDGESYRAVASDTPNITRQAPSNIHQDEERRRWYLKRDADRVALAVEIAEAEGPVGGGPATVEEPESPPVTGQATLTDVLASAPGEGD